MGASAATVTVSNFDIGPCQVNWGSSPVDLGGTLKNVNIKFKYDKTPLKADQFGSSILDMAISGMECTVDTELTETRNRVTWSKVFPSAILGGTSPHQYNDFKDETALRQLSLSDKLMLHPLVDASASHDQEWIFWKALPLEDSAYVFHSATQASLKVTWRILLDTSQSPARMFRVGDQSL